MTKPKKDPDLGLDLYRFNIPTLKVLREVMIAEQKAVAEIRAEITRISSASDSMLVDPQGKPIPQVGGTGTAAEQAKALVDALLARPILSTSYRIMPGPGGEPTLTSFEPAGLKLACVVYLGVGKMLMAKLGPNITAKVGNQIDMVLVHCLKAIGRHRNPYLVISRALQFRAYDAATKAPVLGEPAWADQVRRDLTQLMLTFLVSSGYAEAKLGLNEARAALLTAGPDMPELSLMASGERLYLHLRDQVALKVALQTQGPVLTQEAAARAPETKTMAEIERDLANPNTPLHEA